MVSDVYNKHDKWEYFVIRRKENNEYDRILCECSRQKEEIMGWGGRKYALRVKTEMTNLGKSSLDSMGASNATIHVQPP